MGRTCRKCTRNRAPVIKLNVSKQKQTIFIKSVGVAKEYNLKKLNYLLLCKFSLKKKLSAFKAMKHKQTRIWHYRHFFIIEATYQTFFIKKDAIYQTFLYIIETTYQTFFVYNRDHIPDIFNIIEGTYQTIFIYNRCHISDIFYIIQATY